MPKDAPFQTVIDALLDESRAFPARLLHRFSDLPTADMKSLLAAWPGIPLSRKQHLLEDLEDLAESDTLTNFDELGGTLLQDPEASVRTAGIHLLFETCHKKYVPVYLDLLDHDPEGEVRAAAANILGQYVLQGELEEIPQKLHHEIEDHLLEAAKQDKVPLVRRRALESLGYSSRSEVVPLIETAYANRNPEWVGSALFAMGRSADERWRKQVLTRLHAPDETIRVEAVRAAGELELAAARPILFEQLEDEEDLELRREIIWALSKLGGEGVRARLEELIDMENDDEEVEFIEEALDNLFMSENMSGLDMLTLPSDEDGTGKDEK